MAEKKKSWFRKIIGWLHLWLGLTSGLVVFIIAVTGCLYAFQDEIQNAMQPYRFTVAQNKPVLPPSQLKAIAEKELPGKKIHAVLYSVAGRSAQVIFYNLDPEYYYFVYLDPYSGEVLKVSNENAGFFRFVLDGHYYLWLPPAIGQPVVAVSTLVFVVMLITGIVLWWPKNRKAAKQRFSIQWSARWRRKNYDLHNVLGFYASWVAIILALTGLVWGFQWFAKGAHALAGGTKSLFYAEPMVDSTAVAQAGLPASDRIWMKMKAENPGAQVMEVHVPETKASPIVVTVNFDNETYWKTDYRYFDPYTLEELEVDHVYGKLAEANAADKLLRMNYDIHTGAIIGLPGKILAFCAGLLCASLPITGFCIWWGRRKKDRREAKQSPRQAASRRIKTANRSALPKIPAE
ncbi:PepSY-associated TM helix domain-containing protein [Chryseolinea soli]|uniref:PepSY domain-containing protein n=1 Tax=Chryseolinea soli TaxID=2321403 RepID=A0A385SXG3_9BACT|nr:PepSY-associated TM helix domain-containing protein [Chryseolinea soli]AYB34430.1 PepSY domain-containing protein [Chryseolinea soli]